MFHSLDFCFDFERSIDGRRFLAANREKEGVFVLPSGLQYKAPRQVVKQSWGATKTMSAHHFWGVT